jgi:predicted permease
VVLLAETYWRREFGADASAIGRTLTLNDTVFEIAGVWPASARLDLRHAPDLWRVLPEDPLDASREGARDGVVGYALALLRPGVGVAEVEAELAGLTPNLEDVPEGVIPSIGTPSSFLGNDFVQGLWLVFAGGLALVLVSIVNTANLLLGRTLSRSGELALRMAVGGSRASLIRLFLVESLLLTAAGVAIGAALAAAGSGALSALLPQRLTVLDAAVTGRRVIFYTSMIAAVCAIVCTVVPALWLGRRDLHALMTRRIGDRASAGSSRGQAWLVAVQAAFAMLLVTGGAMTARSFQRLRAVDPGVELSQLLSFAVSLPENRYGEPAAARAFHETLRSRLLALPGVRGVTTSDNPLLNYTRRISQPYFDGEARPDDDGTFTSIAGVHPGFFGVAGISLIAGRDFPDTEGEREVIVNQAFARRYSGSVLGRLLRMDEGAAYRIVGIAEDVRSAGLADAPDRVELYMRSPGFNSSYERYIMRTAGDPAAVMSAARATVAEVDPVIPIREAITGPELLRRETARHRFVAMLLAVFAALGLLLAVAGVYGVVSLDVSRRSRELGIRMALGAGIQRVAGDVLTTGIRPVLLGVLAGAAASLFGARYIEDVLYAVSTADPASLGLGVLILLGAGGLACWIPAGRACRVDPVRVLRAD